MTKTTCVISVAILLISLPVTVLGADPTIADEHYQKERALAETLKKLVTCKNMGFFQDGDLYCFLTFRGLKMEFAGVNAKDGGTIYVTALGQNQTLSSHGSRCILIAFRDPDLKGIILFRDDGMITHTTDNKKAVSDCR